MVKQDLPVMLKDIYLDGYENLEAFYRDNQELIASNATKEEGMVISASALAGTRDKNLLRSLFPFLTERKLENLKQRGLFDIDKDLIASYYPLLGNNVSIPWTLELTDVVKAIISFIETRELYLNEKKISAFFSRDEYLKTFPSLEKERAGNLTESIVKNLYEIGVLIKEGRRVRLDRKKAFELISLDDAELSSYIIAPTLDEYVRKKSFEFLRLVRKIRGVRKDDADIYITRAQMISGFSFITKEELFHFLILKENDGLVSGSADKKTYGPAVISSDYSVSFSGATPALISTLAEPVSIDRTKIYIISRESILNAFTHSYTSDEIIAFLESVSDNELSKMLKERITFWYEEYSRISLERALVLKADKKTARIIKNIPDMKEYILEEAAEGVFLMDSLSENEWRLILKLASFDMLAPTKGPEFSYSSYEKESAFIESPGCIELNDERMITYDEERRQGLKKSLKDKDPLARRIKEMMISSGVILKKEQAAKALDAETADAFNYPEKLRLLEKACRDKSYAAVVENHSGKTAAGRVEMVESFSEGDHMVLGHKVLSISRLYKVAIVPASLL